MARRGTADEAEEPPLHDLVGNDRVGSIRRGFAAMRHPVHREIHSSRRIRAVYDFLAHELPPHL